MKTILSMLWVAAFVAVVIGSSEARTIIVDKTGLGQYTTIQAAVNVALDNDTVKVFPGVYNEQVVIRKNIVLQGSGYEYTRLVADADPALDMSAGKVMWFSISSNSGLGVEMAGGVLTNCVVWNCITGIRVSVGNLSIVRNCVIWHIRKLAVSKYNGSVSAINCIMGTSNMDSDYILYCRSDHGYGTGGTSADPQFVSATDFRISPTSPCWDTGKPDIYDPDGSRSDMGYYGGPDAPVFPVVTDLRIFTNSDGTVSVQATAQSRY